MSKGPGRVHRAILDAIATPEATAPHGDCYGPGPAGVPVRVILTQLYGPTGIPTRAQRSSVHRAIRVLTARGEIDSYSRGACRVGAAWCIVHNAYPDSCEVCGQPFCHPLQWAVGMPRDAYKAM